MYKLQWAEYSICKCVNNESVEAEKTLHITTLPWCYVTPVSLRSEKDFMTAFESRNLSTDK